MRFLTSGVLIGVVLVAVGCGDSPTGIARSVAGVWVEAGEVPGSSLQVTLAASGSTLSGSGTWSGEALAAGPVTATGSVSADVVTLDLVLSSNPGTGSLVIFEHFTGHLASGKLVGNVIYGQPPDSSRQSSVTFVRP